MSRHTVEHNLLIGCVGKPSAGKSTFLNAATDATAKVGDYPFTTIDPNYGVTYYTTPCPCVVHGVSDKCSPRYGRCEEGMRYIPVKMLDVAGLVPGASEGRGLGNQFLDDLRHADVLLHVIDVSGSTDEKGRKAVGYDPINDITWLNSEIHAWILNNLKKRWSSICRRHIATKSSDVDTMQTQLSGYGTRRTDIQSALNKLEMKEASTLHTWDDEALEAFVSAFVEERFPTVYVLNKIDQPSGDKNMINICKKYGEDRVVPASALAECVLRKLKQQNMIRYDPATGFYSTKEDEEEKEEGSSHKSAVVPLKSLSKKAKARLDNIVDLVLLRFGATGVHDAVRRAVELRGFLPVYPVRSIHNFTTDERGQVFRDCFLIPPGTTVRELASKVHPDFQTHLAYAETTSGMRLGEDALITSTNNIIRFVKKVQVESDT